MNNKFYDILDEYGTNRDALRAVFTAHPEKLTGDTKLVYETEVAKEEAELEEGKKLSKKRKQEIREKIVKKFWLRRSTIERRINNRCVESRSWSLKNYRFYVAPDLAWDSVPIVPENLPIQLYAQGKINLSECYKSLKKCVGEAKAEDMVVKDPSKPGEIKQLNLTRLHEVAVNLVRPYIRRRVAAQSNKYNNTYPFYSYESRSKDMVAKLRAEVLSERVEMISDQYGYRHDLTQVLRKNFLYGHALSFVEKAWDVHRHFRPINDPAKTGEMEDVIKKEGVKFVTPHPTRVGYDMNH
ncbi:MAG: hypothetical protein ACXABY_22610, partial [Candidatus Thorarchaeota archaeon]